MSNTADLEPEKSKSVEQWLDIENFSIPDDELPFLDGPVTTVVKVTWLNENGPTSANYISEDHVQLI